MFFCLFFNNGCLSWWIYLVLRCTVVIFLPLLRFLYGRHKVLLYGGYVQVCTSTTSIPPGRKVSQLFLIPEHGVSLLPYTAGARKNTERFSIQHSSVQTGCFSVKFFVCSCRFHKRWGLCKPLVLRLSSPPAFSPAS